MPTFSKIANEVGCSDFIHPWCNSCLETFLILWKIGFIESVKVYATFYTLSSLITRKRIYYYISQLPVDVFRSSLFLSLNGGLFSFFICFLRYLIKFNGLTVGYIPSFLASGCALSFERKSRRQQLAVYMINIAFQTVYSMLRSRGYVSNIKDGEVLLFSCAAAGILYLFVKSKTPGYITKFLGFLFGYAEIENSSMEVIDENKVLKSRTEFIKIQLSVIFNKFFSQFCKKLNLLYKSDLCMHKYSCIQYIISGFYKPFIVGVMVEYGFSILKNIKSPLKFAKIVLKTKSYHLAMFIGSFSVIFRIMQCVQRKAFNKYNAISAIISGFIAGLANKFYPSVSISMYSITKLVELCCRMYFSKSFFVQTFNTPMVIFFYSVATAIVFNAAILEPKNVPKTYLNFLNKMTHNKLNDINRNFLHQ